MSVQIKDLINFPPVFTMVRHPFSRFVSGYSEKMVRDWSSLEHFESVRQMRDDVLKFSRGMDETS